MNKPITVAREDLEKNVINACNESGLPAFVMAETLTAISGVLRELAKKQLEADKIAYEDALAKEQAEEPPVVQVEEGDGAE